MKKIKFFLFALALSGAAFTSCSDDDNDSTSAAVEGKWYFEKEGISTNGQDVLSPWDNTEGCSKDYMELLDAGVYKEKLFYAGCTADESTGTWSRNGNNFTVTVGTDVTTGEIESLTESNLRVRSVDTDLSTGTNTVYRVTTYTRN